MGMKKKYTPPARLRDTHYWQTGKTKSYRDDERQAAKEPGWRKSAKGKWYFENRRNRSDTRFELEDKYKKMLKDAEEISVTYPGRWEITHRFKRFNKYNVRRWLDTNTGHLNMPSEILSTMVGAKKAGGSVRIVRKRMK